MVTVLLVDDEAELIFTMAERLTLRGLAAVAATTGDDALRLLKEKAFDIVVLDVKMPGISGIDLLTKIRELHPRTKIILQTGRASQKESEEALRKGAFDYLVKPVNIDKLIEKMHEALGM